MDMKDLNFNTRFLGKTLLEAAGGRCGERLEQAIVWAEVFYQDAPLRFDGTTVFDHALRATLRVVAWEGDCEAILAALFHDALEEGGKPQGAILEVIQKQFGPAVATIVRSLSKPGAQAAVDKLRAELTYQQEILCASEHDRQPVMVKVADLIDNLDSLGYLPPERRIKFWAQVPAYYLPLTQAVAPGTVMVAELEAALRRSHPIFLQALEEISGSTLTVCIGEFSDRQEVVAPEAAKQSQPGLFHRLGQILTARL